MGFYSRHRHRTTAAVLANTRGNTQESLQPLLTQVQFRFTQIRLFFSWLFTDWITCLLFLTLFTAFLISDLHPKHLKNNLKKKTIVESNNKIIEQKKNENLLMALPGATTPKPGAQVLCVMQNSTTRWKPGAHSHSWSWVLLHCCLTSCLSLHTYTQQSAVTHFLCACGRTRWRLVYICEYDRRKKQHQLGHSTCFVAASQDAFNSHGISKIYIY